MRGTQLVIIASVLLGSAQNSAAQLLTVETCLTVGRDGRCQPQPHPWVSISPLNPVRGTNGQQTYQPPVTYPDVSSQVNAAIQHAEDQMPPLTLPPVLDGPWTPPPAWIAPMPPSLPGEIRESFVESRLAQVEPQARTSGRTSGEQIDGSSPIPPSRQALDLEQAPRPSSESPVLPRALGGTAPPQEGTGDPVDAGTGELVFTNIDLQLSGVGLDFVLNRVYRSGWSNHGSLGFGWSHNFDQRLEFPLPVCGSEVYGDWHTGEGWVLRFVYDSTGTWITESGAPFRLERRGNDYALIAPDGIERIFTGQGLLSRIVDLNGNTQQAIWSMGTVPGQSAPAPRLATVIDTLGRPINFIYDDQDQNPRGYLKEINVPALDLHVYYDVDANGDLVAFHNPSGFVERYVYDSDPARENQPDLIPTPLLKESCEAACGKKDPSCNFGPCGAEDWSADYWACVGGCDDWQACDASCAVDCPAACEGALRPADVESCTQTCTWGCLLPEHKRADFVEAQRMRPLLPGSPALAACIAGGGREYIWQIPIRFPSSLPHGACLVAPGSWEYATQLTAYLEYLRGSVLDCDPAHGGLPTAESCVESVAPICQQQAQDLSALCADGCAGTHATCGAFCGQRLRCAKYVPERSESILNGLYFDSALCSTSWEACALRGFIGFIIELLTPNDEYWTGDLCSGPSCPPASEDGWQCNSGSCMAACGSCSGECVDALATTCAAGVESLCENTCEDTCRPMLAEQCTAGCNAECQSACHDSTICLNACQNVSAHDACIGGCVEGCVTANAAQGVSYGHPRASNHNLLRIIDGENRDYVVNTYQTDPTKPDFDRVIRQEFGGEEYLFKHYDLTQPRASIEAALAQAGDTGRVDPAPIALNVCPSACDTKMIVPPGQPGRERWIEVTRGNYLVFGGLSQEEGQAAWHFETPASPSALGASRWYELHRVASNVVLIKPNVPLQGDLIFEAGGKLVTLRPSGEGDLWIIDTPAATADAIFSRDDRITLVHAVAGDWRGFPGRAAHGARISRAGACSPEFGVVRDNDVVAVELGACDGVVAFQLLGERADGAGDTGLLASPYWITTWSFSSARSVARPVGTKLDRAPGSFQPDTCLPVIPLGDPDPDCWDALGAWSDAPPDMPWPDCHQPWMTRNQGMGPSGEMPSLGCDNLPERPPGPALPFGPDCNTRDHEDYGPPVAELNEITQATVVVEPDGRIQTYYATPSGRIVRRSLPEAGATEDWSYDENGTLIGHRSAFGDRVCVRYDTQRNPVRSTHLPADGKWAPHGPIARTIEYEPNARPSFIHPANGEGLPQQLIYDARSNLREVRVPDPLHTDLITTFDLDPTTGRPRTVTFPGGRVDRFEYDSASGALYELHQADGTTAHRVIRTVRDGLGRVIRVEPPNQPAQEWTLAKDGRIQAHRVTLSASHLTQAWDYGYDEAGLLIGIFGPTSDQHFTLNGQGQVVSTREESFLPSGLEQKTTCFDVAAGRVRKTIDPEGRWTVLDRGPTGEVTRISRGRVALDGSPWQAPCVANLTDASEAGLEIFEQIGRDSASGGIVELQVSGPASIGYGREDDSVRYFYDAYARLVERRSGDNKIERFGYDAAGRNTWTAVFEGALPPLPSGVVPYQPDPSDPTLRSFVTYVHDPQGRVVEERVLWFADDEAGNRTFLGVDGWIHRTYRYDDIARSLIVTEDDQKATEVRFDILGRAAEVIYPDAIGTRVDTWSATGLELTQRFAPYPTPSGFLEQTITFTPAGSVERVEDSTGRPSYRAEYDDLGRRVSEWSELGSRRFVWDGFGRLSQIEREGPNGLSAVYQAWTYNRNDLVSSVSDALSERVTYAYDRANRPISEVFPGGASNSTIYLEGTSLPSHQSLRGGEHRSFGYDSFGGLAWAQGMRTWNGFQAALSTFERSATGLVSAGIQTANESLVLEDSISTTYSRDSRGAVLKQVSSLFPSEPMQIERDWAGRVSSASRGGHALGSSYDGAGRVVSRSYDGTAITTHTYSGFGEATSTTLGNGLVELRSFDHRGRVSSISAALPLQAAIFGYQNYYGEDGLLARTDETIGAGGPSSTLIESDGWGRLSRSGAGATGLAAPAGAFVSPSELLQWLPQAARIESFGYDDADHLTQATRSGVVESAQIAADHSLLSWGGASVTNNGAGAPEILPDGTALAYDGFGRVRQATAPSGQIVRFSHDAFGALVSWSVDGNMTKLDRLDGEMIRLDSGSGSQWIVPGESFSPRAIVSASTQTYLHAPIGDRVSVTTGASGSIVERAAFDAFGGVQILAPNGTPRVASAVGNHFFLTGGPWIPELQMHRLGARWYAPELGRFTSPDPLGFADGPNIYAYAGNHPWELIDPFGLERQKQGTASTIGDIGAGLWDFWRGATLRNLSLYGLAIPGAGQAIAFYQGYRLFDGLSQVYARDGLSGAINAANPVSHTLKSGYDAVTAFEAGEVRKGTESLLSAGEAGVGSVFLARGLQQAGAAALSKLEQGLSRANGSAPMAEPAPSGVCFDAGTLVHTSSGLVPIETLRAGDKVSGDCTTTEFDPATWKLVRLELPNPDGSDDLLEIEALRSSDWIAKTGARAEETIYVELTEIGLAGQAEIISINAAPDLSSEPGCLILSTITHNSGERMEISFAGTKEVLRATARHHLYSQDRLDWVAVGDLLPGERLSTIDGEVEVASISALPEIKAVYNLEVETEHAYFVSPLGVLSHNNGLCAQQAAVQAGEAGSYAALKARAIPGDLLTPHHMPQAALKLTSHGEGGALVMHQAEHVLTRTYGIAGSGTARAEAGLPFRTILARDIRDVRGIVGSKYNVGLQGLIRYYETHFPNLIGK